MWHRSPLLVLRKMEGATYLSPPALSKAKLCVSKGSPALGVPELLTLTELVPPVALLALSQETLLH